MEGDLEADSNPLFGHAGGFKPSLMAITEDIEREASSYYRETPTSKPDAKMSSSSTTGTPKVSSKSMIDSEVPQDTSKDINVEKRLSRFSSLSRLIRTKSGRVIKGDLEREEKEEYDLTDSEDRSTVSKKRASILNLFKQ